MPGRPATDDPDTEFFQPIETRQALHHRLLLRKLDDISRQKHGRLMVFMPPGSAKSSYASVVFPSLFLARAPSQRLILASYGDDLARKMGRRTRSIIRQKRYQKIWGCELASDSQAVQEFSLTNGSEYMACGIRSGITGNRAHGIVIDDPIKGREQADSELIRARTWDAYEDDLKTRLIPGGWIALVQTRWHQDDLAGRILPENWNGQSGRLLCRDGFEWDVLCIQARCEVEDDPLGRAPGEYLWPEWFDRKHWAQFESNPRTWNALFQQRPSPLEGEIFKPDRLQVVEELPYGHIDWCRAWDMASTVGGDWTAGAKLGRLSDGRFIIADMRRMRVGPDERDAAMLATAHQDGASVKVSIPQDPGQAGKTQALYMARQFAGFNIHTSPESGDKITRAEPLAAQVNVGNVLLLRGAYNAALLEEMRTFPNGTHDDQIDALSRAFANFVSPPGLTFA